jgi:bacterioferritin-associated ferredoxin
VGEQSLGIKNESRQVEILINGEKRFVRANVPVTEALFEIGQSRPQDMLQCNDGSCGLCQFEIDGIKKLACITEVHPKMSIRIDQTQREDSGDVIQCVCLGVTKKDLITRIRQGKLKSPESILATSHIGEGKCHGQLCTESFKRILQEEGIDTTQWTDWRFPWMDWVK